MAPFYAIDQTNFDDPKSQKLAEEFDYSASYINGLQYSRQSAITRLDAERHATSNKGKDGSIQVTDLCPVMLTATK